MDSLLSDSCWSAWELSDSFFCLLVANLFELILEINDLGKSFLVILLERSDNMGIALATLIAEIRFVNNRSDRSTAQMRGVFQIRTSEFVFGIEAEQGYPGVISKI